MNTSLWIDDFCAAVWKSAHKSVQALAQEEVLFPLNIYC